MKLEYVVKPSQTGMLLREFILLQGISGKALKRIKNSGKILCNEVEKTVRYYVQTGDIITLIFPKENTLLQVYKMPLSIYYEDKDYLVIDKPAGIPCIPTRKYPNNTLANAILYYYQINQIEATIHIVSRLDKETSGLLVVAKHSHAHAVLSKDIKQVQRIYHCLVEGHLVGDGTINQPILRHGDSIKREVNVYGKKAITRYEVIKQIDGNTLVKCQLETGRTHQIRVHMAYIGHPLCNDPLYGNKQDQNFYLESVFVSFIQPFINIEVSIAK
ncbi:MAG: RluA family pseudouridine synthase [Coprobacillaceae bacterium]